MEIGIIGLPRCGKTSVFNVLTGGAAQDAPSYSGKVEPNIAVVKVPDRRLDALAKIYNPRKITQASIHLIDVAGLPASGDGNSPGGLPEHMVKALANAEALLAVVCAFEPQGGVPPDPEGEIETINLELLISDLQKVENRLERIERHLKRPASPERDRVEIEQAVLIRAQEALEKNRPLRSIEFTPDEEKLLRGFQFLSKKPILYLINIGEDALMESSGDEILKSWSRLDGANSRVGVLCAQIEAEIATLEPEEQREFLRDFAIDEPAFGKIIQGCYDVMGLVSFLTAGEPEVRAWPVRRGSTAPEAAGVIHGDIQSGFVRAEVVTFSDLVECGSFAEARRRGLLRAEGKAYIVKDNDVIHFLHAK